MAVFSYALLIFLCLNYEAANSEVCQIQVDCSNNTSMADFREIKGAKGLEGDEGQKEGTGDKGPQGDKGLEGDKGQKGEIGDKGTQGDKGLEGDQGQKGETGDKGPQGDKGLQGENGNKGEIGNQGLPGYNGLKGEQGQNGGTGDKGPQGDKGLEGDKGQKGEIGDKGLQGDKGLEGDQGQKGQTGDKGPQGDKGLDGEHGKKGETGDKGLPGDKGLKGNLGQRGETGDKGPQGDKGLKGDLGQRGETGDKGPQGDKGLAGENGKKGEIGDKGLPGDKGPAGDPAKCNACDTDNKETTVGLGTKENPAKSCLQLQKENEILHEYENGDYSVNTFKVECNFDTKSMCLIVNTIPKEEIVKNAKKFLRKDFWYSETKFDINHFYNLDNTQLKWFRDQAVSKITQKVIIHCKNFSLKPSNDLQSFQVLSWNDVLYDFQGTPFNPNSYSIIENYDGCKDFNTNKYDEFKFSHIKLEGRPNQLPVVDFRFRHIMPDADQAVWVELQELCVDYE